MYHLPLHDQSWVAGGGAREGGNCRPVPDSVPGPHQSIDIACGGAPEMSQNDWGRRLQGEHERGSAMADRPPDDGLGNCRPPCRMPLDNWLMSRVGWPRKNGRQRSGLRHHSIRVKTQAGNTRNICPRCSLPLRYASVLCFAASVRLVCGPRPW